MPQSTNKAKMEQLIYNMAERADFEDAVVEREEVINPVFDVFWFLVSIRRKYRILQRAAIY